MKCFKCGKEIEGLKSILPLDRPYVNLPFHRDCYKNLGKNVGDELAYVTKHYARIKQYVYDTDVKPLRKRRKRK